MKIFLRLKAFYNFMELAEIPPTKKRRHEDKRNKTYVHRKLGQRQLYESAQTVYARRKLCLD